MYFVYFFAILIYAAMVSLAMTVLINLAEWIGVPNNVTYPAIAFISMWMMINALYHVSEYAKKEKREKEAHP